jgi:hypothetical protein
MLKESGHGCSSFSYDYSFTFKLLAVHEKNEVEIPQTNNCSSLQTFFFILVEEPTPYMNTKFLFFHQVFSVPDVEDFD